MAGKLVFTLEEYKDAARKYRSELLMLPIIGINDTLQFMTGRPGIRYKESVGYITADAQFAPYKASRKADANLNLDFRTLETFFGNVVAEFEPNSAISTLLGTGATRGDGQKSTPTAKHVLACVLKALSEHLNDALWKAKRVDNGDTTMELFNGFDTITAAEIADNNISASAGNYIKLTEEITKANAVDVAKDILYKLDPRLRSQKCYMYCSQDFVDKYNEDYKLTTGAIPYNTTFGQQSVEGSNGNLIFVPLYNKADSNFIHISPKSNMLVGYDTMADANTLEVERFAPFILSLIGTMFFGCQFESIDKRKLMVVETVGSASATNGASEQPNT